MLCNQNESYYNIERLRKNYTLLELIREDEGDQTGVLCSLHKEESIRYYCQVCESEFCVKCLDSHNGHKFIWFEESRKIKRKIPLNTGKRLTEKTRANPVESLRENLIRIIQSKRNRAGLLTAAKKSRRVTRHNGLF